MSDDRQRFVPRQVFRTWRPRLIGGLAVVVLSIVIGISPAFKDCIKTQKNENFYGSLRAGPGVIYGSAIRLELHAVCVEDWAEKYEGPIGAIATVFIALFTLTLWAATEKLWQSAENQLAEFRNSLRQSREIADEQVAKMEGSVQEAARAAHAMEDVAISMNAQRDLMHGQHEIMSSQRDISLATQRAWITADVEIAGPAKVADGGGEVSGSVTLILRNTGVLPAYTDQPEVGFYPWGSANDENMATLRISSFVAQPVVRKSAIFPQQPVTEEVHWSLRVPEIEKAMNTLGGFVVVMRGAIRYDYLGATETHFTTFHVHVLRKQESTLPIRGWRTIPTENGVSVPADELFVTHMMGNTQAT